MNRATSDSAPDAPGTKAELVDPTASPTPRTSTSPPVAPGGPVRKARRTLGRNQGRRGRLIVPSAAAGVGLALSLPPWGLWILAFPAAGLLWWRLGGLRLRSRLLVGWVAGLGLYVPGLWWSISFNVYGGIVLILVESLAPVLACAFVPRRARGRAASLAGAMVLAEALRSNWPFGGLPIGGLALGQAGGPLGQSARLGGLLLLVGLVFLGGGATGIVVATGVRWTRLRGGDSRMPRGWQQLAAHGARVGYDTPRDGPPRAVSLGDDVPVGDRAPVGAEAPVGSVTPPGATHRPAVPILGPMLAAALLVGAVAGIGAWGAAAPDGGASVGTVRVAAVQGGGAQGLRKSEVSPASVFAAQKAATNDIPARDGGRPPALVVWPEDTVSLDGLLEGSAAQRELADIATSMHVTLVVGVTESVSNTRFLNEIVAFDPSGRIVARFEKVHRVPFGEYVPYRGFFRHLADLSGVPLDAIPGHGDGVLRTPVGPLGTMVSYEVFYADRGRIATRAGAHLLTDPTNTASYATSQVPTQEIAAARLQAIAEGRDLVQAAPTGYSAVIDHRGTVRARSALGRRQVIVRDVALRTGATLYQRGGDLPVLVVAGLLVVAGWVAAFSADGALAATGTGRRRRPVRRRVRP